MPPRIILSVTRLVTFAPRGNPAAVGRRTELLTEPRSIYRYSILALQLPANIVSMPPPIVQPTFSLLFVAPMVTGMPVAVDVDRARSVCRLP